ncbi:hypothetical protein Barb6XT_02678 [Bacteroidales bacterium Barb6XT]|nr:hypothetical protein Barb6XT_02678 [Bacteroidales bacterium Barb6XT]
MPFKIVKFSLDSIIRSEAVRVAPNEKNFKVTYMGEPVDFTVEIASLVKGADFELYYQRINADGDKEITDNTANAGLLYVGAKGLGNYAGKDILDSLTIQKAAFAEIEFDVANCVLGAGETYKDVTAADIKTKVIAVLIRTAIGRQPRGRPCQPVHIGTEHRSRSLRTCLGTQQGSGWQRLTRKAW